MAFSDAELDRYARHIVLREIGGPGQRRLKQSRVLVVGAGGLGSPALLYLAAAGVGTLGVADDDVVSLSNLQRQVIHATSRIGEAKTASAAATVAEINPEVTVEPHPVRVNEGNAAELIGAYDLVLDGTDDWEARRLVNATCATLRKPLVAAAIGQWDGQISVYRPWEGGPCWRCVFPERPAAGLAPTCAEAGVLGALAGVIGCMMAGEAVKEIVGAGESLSGRLLLWDMLASEARTVRISARPGCPDCAAARTSEPS